MNKKLNKKLIELHHIREHIKATYQRLNELEKEIIDEIVADSEFKSEYKSIDIDDKIHADLVWAFEKRIDYDRLKAEQPELWQQGLYTAFSPSQCLKGISHRALVETVLKDYTTLDGHYTIKTKEIKKGVRRNEV